MEKRFQDLPNWTFWIDEVSVGVYNVKGKDQRFGFNLDLTGRDPEQLLKEAKQTAANLDNQTRREVN